MAAREWLGPKIYPSKGYREVTAAYPCDETGKKVYESDRIALEMPYGPTYPIGYAQAAYRSSMNEFIRCEYRVTQVKEIASAIPFTGWVFDDFGGDICPQLKGWKNSRSHDRKMPLGYGYFTPERSEGENCFILWIPTLAMSGNMNSPKNCPWSSGSTAWAKAEPILPLLIPEIKWSTFPLRIFSGSWAAQPTFSAPSAPPSGWTSEAAMSTLRRKKWASRVSMWKL